MANVKLAQAIGPMMAQVLIICDAVHQSDAGPLSQAEKQECIERAILAYGSDPQSVTDEIANDMAKPPWILIGVLGAGALIGGAWFWSRRRRR